MKIVCYIPVTILLLATLVLPDGSAHAENTPHEKAGLHWIRNGGQLAEHILFTWKSPSAGIAIQTDGEIHYRVKSGNHRIFLSERPVNPAGISLQGTDPGSTQVNVLKGQKARHLRGIPVYRQIRYQTLWPGIDMSLISQGSSIEKVLFVTPGSDPTCIRFSLGGCEDLCQDEDGSLQVDLVQGSVYFSSPKAWQEMDGRQRPVEVTFVTDPVSKEYGFSLGKYDPAHTVYIDPLFSSGFLGGSQWDYCKVIRTASNGNVVVGGITESIDIPATPEAFDESYNDSTDIFVAIFDPSLQKLLQCSFIGGSSDDVLEDLTLDDRDHIYLTGKTGSTDFPVTENAYDTSFNTPDNPWLHDMFISCLTPLADSLRSSTFLGSKGEDRGLALAIDSSGYVIIAGQSTEGLPPVGTQLTNQIESQFVMAKLDSLLTQLIASNIIPANDILWPRDMVVDSSNQIWVVGDTYATDLPTTNECLADSSSGFRDVFIMRMHNGIDTILAMSFLGGKGMEMGHAIITDSLNRAIVTGTTDSDNFPLSVEAFDQTLDMSFDAFISILDSNLIQLEASGFWGGKGNDSGHDLAFDSLGMIYVTGYTNSEHMPVFCDSYQQEVGGADDAFVISLSPQLNKLYASTYLGGSKIDHGYSIALNRGDTVYVAGYTGSPDFPTHNALEASYQGGLSDGFIAAFDPGLTRQYPCCPGWIDPPPFTEGLPTGFKLEWENVEGATDYAVVIKTSSGSTTYDAITHLWTGGASFIHLSDLPCGDSVYIQVQPVNQYGLNEGEYICETWWYIIAEPFHQQDTLIICEGDSLTWHGMHLFESGNYLKEYSSVSGCDSIYQLELEVNPAYFMVDSAQICDGEHLFWQGEYLDAAGSYSKLLQTVEGCDSLLTLHLEILPVYETHTYASICEGEDYSWQGQSLSLPGIYTLNLLTEEHCDSLIILQLEVLPEYAYFDTLGICQGDMLSWQGLALDDPGDYSAVYFTTDGCDSTYFLHLESYPSYSLSQTIYACEQDTIYWEGQELSGPGIYYAYYLSQYGCDSNYILHLETYPDYQFEEIQVICSGETLNWQDMLLSSPGEYNISYATEFGCDSTYHLELTVIAPDTSVSMSGNSLWVTDVPGNSYQWLFCPDLEPIPNATEALYTADSSGSFAVIVESQNCVDTSSCHEVLFTHSPNNPNLPLIVLFPNPVKSDELWVEGIEDRQHIMYSILDTGGRMVMCDKLPPQGQSIRIDKLDSGVYFVKLTQSGESVWRRLVVVK